MKHSQQKAVVSCGVYARRKFSGNFKVLCHNILFALVGKMWGKSPKKKSSIG